MSEETEPAGTPPRQMGGFRFTGLDDARPTAGGVPARPWHSAAPDLDTPEDWPDWLPEGPALLYVHQDHTTDTRTVTRVDHSAPHEPDNSGRERALCRALLVHALHLLDEVEGRD